MNSKMTALQIEQKIKQLPGYLILEIMDYVDYFRDSSQTEKERKRK